MVYAYYMPSFTQFLGARFGELHEQTEERLRCLREKYEVVVIRECEIRRQLKNDEEMARFFDNCLVCTHKIEFFEP